MAIAVPLTWSSYSTGKSVTWCARTTKVPLSRGTITGDHSVYSANNLQHNYKRGAGVNHRQILLVEDNPTDEALLRRALQKAGIANPLVTARDGLEAI